MHYSHTQKIPDKVLAVAALAGLAAGLTPPGLIARLAVVGVMGAVGYSFRSMTVGVDDDNIFIQFGDGPIKKSFALAEISTVKTVRTTPLNGWGIRWLGNGWLYNIYGLDAVELSFRNGKRALIGSDEPDKLVSAIDGRLIVVDP